MLARMSPCNMQPCEINKIDERWSRNEMEDLCKGIEYLYEFKSKIAKLHPNTLDVIENMLQRPRY